MALSLGLGIGLTRGQGGGFFNGLDLDFVANRYALNGPYSAAFPAGWSFSRTGAGTAETSGGVIVPFGTGVPRITDRGLLVEEARTNEIPRSQEFDNAAWSKSAVTVTANQIVAPNGTTTADLVTEIASSSSHSVYGTNFAITAGVTYSLSVFIWPGTRRYVAIRGEAYSPGNFAWVTLDTQTGAVAANAGATGAATTLVAGGFWRVTFRFVAFASTGGANIVIAGSDVATAPAPSSTLGPSYLGTGATFGVWQADLQAGSFTTSPIITTGAAATRGVDVADQALPLASGQDVSLFAEVDFTRASSSTQRILEWHNGTSGAGFLVFRSALGEASVNIVNPGQLAIGTVARAGPRTMKIAVSRIGSLYSAAVDGISIGTLTSANMPPLTTLRIGDSPFVSACNLNDYVRRVRQDHVGRSLAELQALTA